VSTNRIDITQPILRVENFESLDDNALRRVANACFERAESIGQNPMATSHLLQAQFYLAEIARRERDRDRRTDSRIATRDFWIELAVVVLIILEIIIAVWGGYEQDKILRQMSGNETTGLANLVDEQKKSLGSLTLMNNQLQDSVKKTGDMAVAMQRQLMILQDEQTARQAELAKKPKLELYVENIPIASLTGVNFNAREIAATKLTFDINLLNSGNATATKGQMRVVAFAKDVTITSNVPSQPIYETEKDSTQHGIIILFDYIRPTVKIAMSVTFTFPAGQEPFPVYFNVDAEEIPPLTPLGYMTVRPAKP
jgi:hypothetical protein